MQLRAELVHADAGVRVVQVSAWRNGDCLGSTLAEAASVEQAEQAACQRLLERLGGEAEAGLEAPMPSRRPRPSAPTPAPSRGQAPNAAAAAAASRETPQPASPAPTSESAPPQAPLPLEPAPLDPDDWSDELAQLDVQLQRIGWQREQESAYLERAFGHPSRSRITSYADLRAYLEQLRQLAPGCPPQEASVPLRRATLLQHCDQLLASLGWDAQRGRSLLESEFQLSSRQQLNDSQLLQFNMLLEEQLLAAPEPQLN